MAYLQRLLLVPFCIALFSSTRGSEVYLSGILIHKTHDRFTKPTVYFQCEGDGRGKTLLGSVTKVEHLYSFGAEEVALTHVDKATCRELCGIWDKDTVTSDDLFGRRFRICDTDFPAKGNHTLAIDISGEVHLTLLCPECNSPNPPPPSPPPPPPAPGAPQESSSDGLSTSARATVVAASVVGALAVGFLGGCVVYRTRRAWRDVVVEEARIRFQALYADPLTDIEDLPNELPTLRQDGFMWLVRRMRAFWVRDRGRGYQTQLDTLASQAEMLP